MPCRAEKSDSRDGFLEEARALLLHEFGTDHELWAWFQLSRPPIQGLFAAAALADGLGTIGLARVDQDDLAKCRKQGRSAHAAVTALYAGREEAELIVHAIRRAFPGLVEELAARAASDQSSE